MASRVAEALQDNTNVRCLELDFTSCLAAMEPPEPAATNTTCSPPANYYDHYADLLHILSTTTTLQRVQLFGARQETVVTEILPHFLRAVQQRPTTTTTPLLQLDLVSCRLQGADFVHVPPHTVLRGVQVVQPHLVAPALQQCPTPLRRLRLTSYVGIGLVQEMLEWLAHNNNTLEHVGLFHHGDIAPFVQPLARLWPRLDLSLQLEYVHFVNDAQLPALLQHQKKEEEATNAELIFTSCTFYTTRMDTTNAHHPCWSALAGLHVTWQGFCPALPTTAPTPPRVLDISKVVIDRHERLAQVLSSSTTAAAASMHHHHHHLRLGDLSTPQVVELLIPALPALQGHLECTWRRHNHNDEQVVESLLRDAVRRNAGLVSCAIRGLGQEAAAAIAWYTQCRNRHVPRVVRECLENEDPRLLPRVLYEWLQAASPTATCALLMEELMMMTDR